MQYNVSIYKPSKTNPDFRFILGIEGRTTLYVVGLNPSTADDKKPDRTITKVMGYAVKNGYDSFAMLNLYPQRTPDPDRLHPILDTQLHHDNIYHILTTLNDNACVLAAWGETITVRDYFKECLADLYKVTKDKKIQWLKIGELTASGHPRHPSRAAYCELTSFDIDRYLTGLK